MEIALPKEDLGAAPYESNSHLATIAMANEVSLAIVATKAADFLVRRGILYKQERVSGVRKDDNGEIDFVYTQLYKIRTLKHLTTEQEAQRKEARARSSYAKSNKDEDAIPIIGNFLRKGLDDVLPGVFNSLAKTIPLHGKKSERSTARPFLEEDLLSPNCHKAMEEMGIDYSILEQMKPGLFTESLGYGVREMESVDDFKKIFAAILTPPEERMGMVEMFKGYLGGRRERNRKL